MCLDPFKNVQGASEYISLDMNINNYAFKNIQRAQAGVAQWI